MPTSARAPLPPPVPIARSGAVALVLGAALLLGACAPQGVREDAVVPSPAQAAEAAALIEPGSPPPDLTAPGDEIILQRLRERAASRRAQLKLDEGADRDGDVWARIRAGLAFPRHSHRSIDAELAWYAGHPEYLQRTTDRARLYLAYIVSEAEQRNVPMELALLPIVESAFQPYAQSPAGAMGIWQFIRPTGKRFGLTQTAWYDGRRDIVASTRAAFDYLEKLHEHLDGDWLLAVAAYNAGEGNIMRARRRNRARGKPDDFFSLRLPAETRAYVPRLMAIAELVRAPEAHGVTLDPIDDTPYFRSVDVGGQIDLAKAAEMAGITLNEMMLLNPGYFRHATDPRGPHRLLVPADAVSTFNAALASTDPDALMAWGTHTVSHGDTLSAIAVRYGMSVEQIRSLNGMDGSLLQPGQELRVPGFASVQARNDLSPEVRRGIERAKLSGQRRVYRVRSGDNLWTIARRNRVSLHKLMSWNGLGRRSILRPGQKLVIWTPSAAPRTPPAPQTEPGVHVVRSGENLWFIARRYQVSTDDLARWNDIEPASILQPGQKLRLTPPRSASAHAPSSPAI